MDVGIRLGVGIMVVGRAGDIVYAVGGAGEGSVGVGFAMQAPRKTINTNKCSCTLILMLVPKLNPKIEQAG